MKLKNVELGMKVVVKRNNTFFFKGEIVEVVNVDLLNAEWDVCTVWVESNRTGNRYWLNHKDIKKLKEVQNG